MWNSYQLDLIDQIDGSLVCSRQWLQLGGSCGLSAESLSLVKQVVFRCDGPKAIATALENAHHYHNLISIESSGSIASCIEIEVKTVRKLRNMLRLVQKTEEPRPYLLYLFISPKC